MKIFENKLPEYNVIGSEEIEGALEVLRTGQLSGFVANASIQHLGGEYVQRLESLFCKKFGVEFAATFNSATSAIHAALVAVGIKEGDEVIVPTWSMSASATSIVMAGATPVFVDIEEEYFCIDTTKILSSISVNTKAIVVVNLFGMPADLKKIREICDAYNLILIEDNAQAPAAICNNKLTGSYGDISIYSLNRHKTIQCGEGGVATTNNEKYIHRLRLVRNHAESVFPEFSEEEKQKGGDDIVGYNYRLTSLQAAVAIPQVKRLDSLNSHRINLANLLTEKIKEINFLRYPKLRKGCNHVYYLYPMIFDRKKAGFSRDIFIDKMSKEGAPISGYSRPIYRMPLFKLKFGNKQDYSPKNFPVTEFLWENIVTTSICRPPLTEEHVYLFVKAINKVLKT